MAGRFFFDQQLGLSVFEYMGVITGRDLEQLDNMVIAHPLAEQRVLDLTDLRGVTRFALTSDDVDASVRRWAGLYANTRMEKLAFVAPRDIGFGLSRVFESLAPDRPYDTRVFRQLREAENWLGVSPGTVDTLTSGDPVAAVPTSAQEPEGYCLP